MAEGEAILDAALRAGMDLPFACKGGMCSTCRAKLVEGEAQMEVNYSLEPWELKAGFILTCQARPVSDKVVVDYDHVSRRDFGASGSVDSERRRSRLTQLKKLVSTSPTTTGRPQ